MRFSGQSGCSRRGDFRPAGGPVSIVGRPSSGRPLSPCAPTGDTCQLMVIPDRFSGPRRRREREFRSTSVMPRHSRIFRARALVREHSLAGDPSPTISRSISRSRRRFSAFVTSAGACRGASLEASREASRPASVGCSMPSGGLRGIFSVAPSSGASVETSFSRRSIAEARHALGGTPEVAPRPSFKMDSAHPYDSNALIGPECPSINERWPSWGAASAMAAAAVMVASAMDVTARRQGSAGVR